LIGFGIFLQAVCFTALTPLLLCTKKYAEVVRENLKTETLRVFAWIGPFFFLLVSVNLVTLGLYNRGLNERMENSRMRSEVFRKCYLPGLNCGSKRIVQVPWLDVADVRRSRMSLAAPVL